MIGPLHNPLRTHRAGVLIAASILVAEGVWLLMTAFEEQSVILSGAGSLALCGALGLLRARRPARFIAYGFTIAYLLIGLYEFYEAAILGDFVGMTLPGLTATVAPGLGLGVLSIATSTETRAYFRQPALANDVDYSATGSFNSEAS
jgi:hypothetical protein